MMSSGSPEVAIPPQSRSSKKPRANHPMMAANVQHGPSCSVCSTRGARASVSALDSLDGSAPYPAASGPFESWIEKRFHSLRDYAGEDDRFVWRVEVAGRAANVATYPDSFYQTLADLCRWVVTEMGVPDLWIDYSCCELVPRSIAFQESASCPAGAVLLEPANGRIDDALDRPHPRTDRK